jgi:membrane-anchored glycerophosphoryl diester phosphodiesterase (GDPDase)
MKKHFKKILLAIVVIIVLFFAYKQFFAKTEVAPEFKEEIIVVSTGSIKDSITAV